MLPIIAAGILGAVQGGVALGSQIAANAQTGNSAKIRALKSAQGRGQLTPEGEAEAMAGRAQELQGIAAADASTTAALGQMGATSGRDIAAAGMAKQAATRDASQRFTDRWAQTFAGQSQELEDRKAIRRDRTNKAVSTGLEMAGQGAQSAGSFMGLTQKGPAGEPDWKALAKVAGKDVSARLQAAYNKLGYKEFKTMATEVFGAEMADAYMTAAGLGGTDG